MLSKKNNNLNMLNIQLAVYGIIFQMLGGPSAQCSGLPRLTCLPAVRNFSSDARDINAEIQGLVEKEKVVVFMKVVGCNSFSHVVV